MGKRPPPVEESRRWVQGVYNLLEVGSHNQGGFGHPAAVAHLDTREGSWPQVARTVRLVEEESKAVAAVVHQQRSQLGVDCLANMAAARMGLDHKMPVRPLVDLSYD